MTTLDAILLGLGLAGVAGWAWLLGARGGFWRAGPTLDATDPRDGPWPAVAAVVPARNEAATIAHAVRSIRAQDYPGALAVVVVDDGSDDGTSDAARAADTGIEVVEGAPLPAGWTGKTWAVGQGVERAGRVAPDSVYLWLTDADIDHDPGELRRLVARAEGAGLDLVSQMVRLHCGTSWERLLVPAFVFFFQKLYPFPKVNDPRRPIAGAAGGTMLVRRSALARIGGIAAIRDALIDDCALARAVKRGGPIWLGLTRRTHSLRVYDRLSDVWAMVARTAFDQLGYSWLALAGTLIGMVVLYLAPPALVLAAPAHGDGRAALLGVAGWAMMAGAYLPTLRLYDRPAASALLLPIAAAFYLLMTVDSAWRHARGRGGGWKARTYSEKGRASGGSGVEDAGKAG